jgi:hypothetical protein
MTAMVSPMIASIVEGEGEVTALPVPGEPEKPRDCKGWLTAHRVDGQSYRPTTDQAALTAIFDISTARRNAPSFDKFCRDVERLLKP